MGQLLQWIVITVGANQPIAVDSGLIIGTASAMTALLWQVNDLKV